MRLGILTDIHRCQPGSPPDGWHNPHQFETVQERLRASLAYLETEGVDRVAVLGDLSHYGDLDSLKDVIAILGESSLPIWVLAGNHDLKPDISNLATAIANSGHGNIAFAPSDPVPFDSVWLATGVGVERGERSGQYQTPTQPQPLAWGDAPLLTLSHFPIISTEELVLGSGFKYPGDLINGTVMETALQERTAPNLVINGHLHVRHAMACGSVLQASCAAQVESLFEVTIIDFGDWSNGRVSWHAISMQETSPEPLPTLSPNRQEWVWEGGGWQAVAG